MSVLVKGMEMPTSCDDCRMSNGIYCYAALDNEYISTNTPKVRPSNCPLIEIQPHGRLVDADALISRIYDAAKQQPEIADLYEDEADTMIAWLKTTPTIIPAEKGEESCT